MECRIFKLNITTPCSRGYTWPIGVLLKEGKGNEAWNSNNCHIDLYSAPQREKESDNLFGPQNETCMVAYVCVHSNPKCVRNVEYLNVWVSFEWTQKTRSHRIGPASERYLSFFSILFTSIESEVLIQNRHTQPLVYASDFLWSISPVYTE